MSRDVIYSSTTVQYTCDVSSDFDFSEIDINIHLTSLQSIKNTIVRVYFRYCINYSMISYHTLRIIFL